MKPKLFIASSVEGLDVAYAVQSNLEYVAEVTVWDQGAFNLSRFPLEDITRAAVESDFSIMVFSADDLTNIRSKKSKTVRDNVILEFGLFVGTIGRARTFIVQPRDVTNFHLPTDLGGLRPGTYESSRSDGNLRAALGPICNEIRSNITKYGSRSKQNMDKYPSLVAFHDTFRGVDWPSLLTQANSTIDIIVYYFDSWVNTNYDLLIDFFRKPGTRIRVFVADPYNEEIMSNLERLYSESSREVLLHKVTHTKERFQSALKDAHGQAGQFEFYYVPFVLNYAVQCIDDDFLVLSFFDMFRQQRIDSPAVIVKLDASEHLERFWRNEFAGIIRSAKRIS